MALINNVGRQATIMYGTPAVYSFNVRKITKQSSGLSGIEYINGGYNTTGFGDVTATTGTLTIAGTTVTLATIDILSSISIANKIASTSITGFTVVQNTFDPSIITLTSTSIGTITKPTVALGTATGVVFGNITFTQGTVAPSAGAKDDILVQGRTPFTVTLTGTGATLFQSSGTAQDQKNGTLSYTSVALSLGTPFQITGNVTYIRVTTGTVQTILEIVK